MTTALDGLQVVEFSWGLAGAITTMVLADNGAEVVKVESPEGDPQRGHPAFAQWHRGKRSVVIDLRSNSGRQAARELAGPVDVVVQSWRPGVAARLGLDYEHLAAANPASSSVRSPGLARTGRRRRSRAMRRSWRPRPGSWRMRIGLGTRRSPARASRLRREPCRESWPPSTSEGTVGLDSVSRRA